MSDYTMIAPVSALEAQLSGMLAQSRAGGRLPPARLARLARLVKLVTLAKGERRVTDAELRASFTTEAQRRFREHVGGRVSGGVLNASLAAIARSVEHGGIRAGAATAIDVARAAGVDLP